jgi:hypothetical protein
MRDTLGIPGMMVAYQLCGSCVDYYSSLDDDDATQQFAADLWQRAAVLHLKPQGTA